MKNISIYFVYICEKFEINTERYTNNKPTQMSRFLFRKLTISYLYNQRLKNH